MIFGPESADSIGQSVRDMIAIKSLSGYESPMASFVQAHLKGSGISTERDSDDNVYAVIEPLQNGSPLERTLHLSGHTDTVVPVEGWQNDPWKPELSGSGEDRRIVGLGASDMKSG